MLSGGVRLSLSALSIGFVADAQIHAACVRWVLLQPLLQELHVQDTFGPCCRVFHVLREVLIEWFIRSFERLVEALAKPRTADCCVTRGDENMCSRVYFLM